MGKVDLVEFWACMFKFEYVDLLYSIRYDKYGGLYNGYSKCICW